MAVLRTNPGPVSAAHLAECWPESVQRDRALTSLLADGLAVQTSEGFALPSHPHHQPPGPANTLGEPDGQTPWTRG